MPSHNGPEVRTPRRTRNANATGAARVRRVVVRLHVGRCASPSGRAEGRRVDVLVMPFDRHDGLVVPAKRVLDQRAVLLVLLEDYGTAAMAHRRSAIFLHLGSAAGAGAAGAPTRTT